MPKVLIDQHILQTAVDYMTKQPFNEVAEIVLAIQNTAKVYEEPEMQGQLPTQPQFKEALDKIKKAKEQKADGK